MDLVSLYIKTPMPSFHLGVGTTPILMIYLTSARDATRGSDLARSCPGFLVATSPIYFDINLERAKRTPHTCGAHNHGSNSGANTSERRRPRNAGAQCSSRGF